MQWSNRAMLRLPTENTLDREENIMAEWITTTLEECTDILGDGLHGTPKYTENGEYAFVNGNNLVDGEILIKKETKRVDYSQYDKYKKPLTNRTILVSINGTLGNVGVYGSEKIILGKRACYFNVKESVDKDFIYYIVSSPTFKQYLESNATGTTIKNISLKQMREYTFELPEIGEQKRISSVLRKIDEKIKNNRAINNNLEQQTQAIYSRMFIEHRQESWSTGQLSDLISVKYGKDHKKLADGNYPVYGSGGIMRYVEKPLYTGESVLIPRKGTLNNVIYVNEAFWSVDTMFYTEMLHPNIAKFVYHFVKSKDLASLNAGSAVPSMTTNILNAMQLYIPDEKTLEKFENIVSPMYSAMQENTKESKILANTRDTLLPKLMSGELDVSDIDL